MTKKKRTAQPARTPPVKRRNPWYGLAVSLISLALLVVVVIMMNRGGPQVERLTLASALDDAYEPVTTTDTFKRTQTFFVSARIANYQSTQDIKARWRYNGGEVGTTGLETHDKAGTITAGFSLSSQDPWPPGRYSVDVMFGDEVLSSATFQVGQ